MLANALCPPEPEPYPPARGALIALLDERPVGLAEWYRTQQPDEAEVAFEVSDAMHGRGVATLLAEHLMLAARRAGIRRLTAITMGENRQMLGVFLALGIPVERSWDSGDCLVTIPLDHTSMYASAMLEAVARREARSDEASLHTLFAPRSIAVLGADGNPATEAVLANLVGFEGTVHRGGARGEELPADASPDLAVVASAAEDVPEAARGCAALHVGTLVVTATGLPVATGRELLEVCRAAGMRLVGPGSLGVAAPGGPKGFSALIAPAPVRAGHVGVAVQSGGVGLALLGQLGRLGVGVGSFAAVGEKYDVSANDVLLHWESARDTRFGLLHVESFGNPRKFARTARRLSRLIPLFAVDPEQSPSHVRTALYAQAGIITLPSLGALIGVAALAAHQPAPAGSRVAVLANTHGMAALAAQACMKAGLDVTEVLDLTPSADEDEFAATAMRVLGERPDGHSANTLLVALAPTAPRTIDPVAAARGAGRNSVVLAVVADQPESVTVLRSEGDPGVAVPSYNDAADAARALAAVLRAARLTGRPEEEIGIPDGVDLPRLEDLLRGWAATAVAGRSLEPAECALLLAALGLRAGESCAQARVVTLTGWQDPVFGPLVSAAAGDDGSVRTLLVPVGPRECTALADQAAGPANFAVADAAVRLSAALDACPALVSARLCVAGAEVVSVSAAVGPVVEENPFLRRLRRAPVE